MVYVNGEPRSVSPASVLTQLFDDQAGGELPRGVAVALDGAVVPRMQLAETVLHEGAKVEIVTAVQGG